MAAAGGTASIITQVQQSGPPVNSLGDVGADETITMDLRGTRFTLSRDELLTLPEFVLLSLFPNGLFPEGHLGGLGDENTLQVDVGNKNFGCKPPTNLEHFPPTERKRASRALLTRLPTVPDLDASHIRILLSNEHLYIADTSWAPTQQYDPASLQFMIDFFRNVASSMPLDASEASQCRVGEHAADPNNGSMARGIGAGDDGKRAGIIVLREDLDFYAIPPKQGIDQTQMMDVKRAAAQAILKQDGIFSGLKRSDEPGTTEAHLIEMLTAGGLDKDDRWGHRAGEPNKAVICSLALARLRSDIRGNEMASSAVGMAQKLLLFWRKPARRCWWEGVDLEGVDGIEEGKKLKVWIRRVWTLEMSVIGLH